MFGTLCPKPRKLVLELSYSGATNRSKKKLQASKKIVAFAFAFTLCDRTLILFWEVRYRPRAMLLGGNVSIILSVTGNNFSSENCREKINNSRLVALKKSLRYYSLTWACCNFLKQECIPVGCVPSAAVAVCRGVSAFGPGGVCFWSRGCLLLVPGVSAFGPGGCVSQHALDRQTGVKT